MSNSLHYNNTIPGNIYYNNAKVQNVYYNNTKVWSASRPFSFTYTGVYEVEGDLEGNYIVRFKTSGTLTIIDHGTNNPNGKYDIFLVGGGATNDYNSHDSTKDYGMGGGGGGYTATYKNLSLSGSHTVVIGEGGKFDNSVYYHDEQIQGKPSKFDSYSVDGGIGIALNYSSVRDKVIKGSNGGSGGGSGGYYNGYDGGSDGSNGFADYSYNTGVGQGSTTREFGESTGRLYAGGGGGGCGDGGTTGGHGGAGGGGNGFGWDSSGNIIDATSGEPNTGGGGGGGRNGLRWPGNGGSGIVCLRNAR